MCHFELDAFGLEDAAEPAVPPVHVQLELLPELCPGNAGISRAGGGEQNPANYPRHAIDSRPEAFTRSCGHGRSADPRYQPPPRHAGRAERGRLPGESVFLTTLVLSF